MKRWLNRILGLEVIDVDIVAILPMSRGRATIQVRNATQENIDGFVRQMLEADWEPVSFTRYFGDAPALEHKPLPLEEASE